MIHKIDELAKNFKEPTAEQLNDYKTWKCGECGEKILETLENGKTISHIVVVRSKNKYFTGLRSLKNFQLLTEMQVMTLLIMLF